MLFHASVGSNSCSLLCLRRWVQDEDTEAFGGLLAPNRTCLAQTATPSICQLPAFPQAIVELII